MLKGIKSGSKHAHIFDENKNKFVVTYGNSKVDFPIINLGSAWNCPSRGWCQFDRDNHKGLGHKMCYAQRTERLYPAVKKARECNEYFVKLHRDAETHFMDELADWIVDLMPKRYKERTGDDRWVRFNEAHDLHKDNVAFAFKLAEALWIHHKIKTYLYSKAHPMIRDFMGKSEFITLLSSQTDFVAYKKEDNPVFPVCPGKCGPSSCMRCPHGKQSSILEH